MTTGLPMTLKIESATSPESAEYIHAFLAQKYSGVLATADGAGTPHAAAIYYMLNDDFSLMFATKHETQKFKNMEENKQVAFVVYDEQEQTTVQITGRVEVMDDEEKLQLILNNMFQSSAERSKAELPPAEKIWAGNYVALKLVPLVVKMAVYARPDSEGDDIFETLLFSE
jgi:general stress protein 26